MNHPVDSVARLREKYEFGSLYLTFTSLNDMTHLLNEEKKFAVLAAKPPRQENLQIFKAFLDSKYNPHMKVGLAFIQLNLDTGKAGFKRSSDRDGTIVSISWSKEQVLDIAEFCDDFLNKQLELGQKHSSISGGEVSVATAWEIMEDLDKDPYVPAVRKDEFDRDFKSLIDSRPGELRDLESGSPEVHTAIQKFSQDYDQRPAPPVGEEPLAPIQLKQGKGKLSLDFQKVTDGSENRIILLKQGKLSHDLQKVIDRSKNCLTILGTQEVQDSLKNAAQLSVDVDADPKDIGGTFGGLAGSVENLVKGND